MIFLIALFRKTKKKTLAAEKVCGFFCDYVIIRAFTGMSMELVRAYALLPALMAMVTKKKKWGRSMYRDVVEVGAVCCCLKQSGVGVDRVC